MSYISKMFEDGQVLTASDLNNLVHGIDIALQTEVNDMVILDQGYDGFTVYQYQSIGPNATLGSMNTYHSYEFTAEKDGILYFSEYEADMHLYFALGHILKGETKGVRYRKSESNLPLKETPLEVHQGDKIILTVPVNDLLFSLYTNTVNVTTNPIILNAIANNKLIVEYINNNIECARGCLLLKKCGDHNNLFLGHLYCQVPDAKINANTWRLSYLMVMERLGNGFSVCRNLITHRNHEWECAIQEEGAADFCGGNAHGDEREVSIVLSLDGKMLDLTQSRILLSGSRFEAYEESLLNRCDTPGEDIMHHFKKYYITTEGINLVQTLQFLETINIVSSYLTMCPVQREYTPHAYMAGKLHMSDVSSAEGHPRPTVQGHSGIISEWGDNFNIEVRIKSDATFENGHIFISNSDSPAYNKIYYSIAGNGPTTMEKDTKIMVETDFKYQYNE